MQLDFSAVNISDLPISKLPTGLYRVVITDAKITVNGDKAPQVQIDFKVTEGEHANTSRSVWYATTVKDTSNAKSIEGLTRIYGDLLMSIGFKAEQLATVKIDTAQIPAMLKGRPAFLRWQNGDKAANVRSEGLFVKPAQYVADMEEVTKLGGPEEYARIKDEAAAKAASATTGNLLAAAAVPGIPGVPGVGGLPAVGGLPGLPPATALPAATALPQAAAAPAAPAAPAGLPQAPQAPQAALAGLAGLAPTGMVSGGLPGLPGLPGAPAAAAPAAGLPGLPGLPGLSGLPGLGG